MPYTNRGIMSHDHACCEKNKCDKCKKKIMSLEAQRRYAWRLVFEERTERLENGVDMLQSLEVFVEEIEEDSGVSNHLQSFIKKLYKDTKEKVECRVCLEVVDGKELKTGKCGHNFHEKCYEMWEKQGNTKCPLCRKKF